MSDIPVYPFDGIYRGTGPGKGVHRESIIDSYDEVIRAMLRGMRMMGIPVIPDTPPGTRYGLISESNSYQSENIVSSQETFTSESNILHVPPYTGHKALHILTPVSAGKIWSFVIVGNPLHDLVSYFRIKTVIANRQEYYYLKTFSISAQALSDRDVVVGQGNLPVDIE